MKHRDSYEVRASGPVELLEDGPAPQIGRVP
jgi:hypothetical protein